VKNVNESGRGAFHRGSLFIEEEEEEDHSEINNLMDTKSKF
jgi:hypothetical protein